MDKIAEAGAALAAAAGNKHLIREFGMSFAIPKIALADLHGFGLPEPFLALTEPSILVKNAQLAEAILRRPKIDREDGEGLLLAKNQDPKGCLYA